MHLRMFRLFTTFVMSGRRKAGFLLPTHRRGVHIASSETLKTKLLCL